jgi:hypothetical protein
MSTQHIKDGGQHVAELEERLRGLAAAHADLAAPDDFDEMHLIMHWPGWTTVPDVYFMNALVDASQRAVDQALELRQALVSGARAIGAAAAE